MTAANRTNSVNALRWRLDSKAGEDFVPLMVNHDRSGQVEPRVHKRRPKEFLVMKKPRSEGREQLTGNFEETLQILSPLKMRGDHKNKPCRPFLGNKVECPLSSPRAGLKAIRDLITDLEQKIRRTENAEVARRYQEQIALCRIVEDRLDRIDNCDRRFCFLIKDND